MESDASPQDILGLAEALSPLDYSDPKQNLLRLAIERDGYGKHFSIEQIERIAQCSKGGAAEAWRIGL